MTILLVSVDDTFITGCDSRAASVLPWDGSGTFSFKHFSMPTEIYD